MSYCTSDIVLLAGQIYSGVGAPSSLSVGYVSGWLTSPNSLGELNNRLSTDMALTGSDPCIDGMGPEEAAIYSLMYGMGYYESQSLAALAGGGSFWQSMAEGDSRITRTSAVDISKAYLALHENAQQTLYVQIAQYKRRLSIPCSVDGDSLPAWPSP